MDDTSSLHQQIRTLPSPPNAFAGVANSPVPLPRNILLFKRTARLQGKESCHHRYVLIMNFGTGGTVMVNGIYFHLYPGEALLIHPYEVHRVTRLDADERCWLYITFELEAADSGAFAAWRSNVVHMPATLHDLTLRTLQSYACAETSSVDALDLRWSLSSILERLRQSAQVGATMGAHDHSPPEVLVRRIVDYVSDNVNLAFTSREVAHELCVSESYLRKLFKQHTGRPLGTYIREYRVFHASRLMVSTASSISVIAAMCGFTSLPAFSRTFTNVIGESPREHRKRLQEMHAGRPES